MKQGYAASQIPFPAPLAAPCTEDSSSTIAGCRLW